MSSSSRRLEEDGKFGGSNLVRFFSLFFSRSWKPSIFWCSSRSFGKMGSNFTSIFCFKWVETTHYQSFFFFDLYPFPKTHQPTPLFSKAALLPSGGQFMGVKTLLFQALTTFLASVSAGVAEEVCSALQVPELEVGRWWGGQEVGGISWGSWVVLNFFFGGDDGV